MTEEERKRAKAEYHKKWRAEHPEKALEYIANKNPEKVAEQAKLYYDTHKEKRREYARKYRLEHAEKCKEYGRNYSKERREREKCERERKQVQLIVKQQESFTKEKEAENRANLSKTVAAYLAIKERIEANRRKRQKKELNKKANE